jgi:benzil reductase ((S)-benzoin forming)
MNLHIVTGASKGLGSALASYLALQGDDVVSISRTKNRLHESIDHFAFDLASMDSKEDLIKKIFLAHPVDRYQKVTLTNNAGLIDPIVHIAELTEASVVRNLAVNLAAPMALTAAFLRNTGEFKGVRVITNISSGVASDPIASWACYSAAKAGLKSFAIAIAKDYALDDLVKVINFSPGVLDTEMQGHIRGIDQSRFPEVEIFKGYKNENKLRTAHEVGTALGAYLLRKELMNFSDISIKNLISS